MNSEPQQSHMLKTRDQKREHQYKLCQKENSYSEIPADENKRARIKKQKARPPS